MLVGSINEGCRSETRGKRWRDRRRGDHGSGGEDVATWRGWGIDGNRNVEKCGDRNRDR